MLSWTSRRERIPIELSLPTSLIYEHLNFHRCSAERCTAAPGLFSRGFQRKISLTSLLLWDWGASLPLSPVLGYRSKVKPKYYTYKTHLYLLIYNFDWQGSERMDTCTQQKWLNSIIFKRRNKHKTYLISILCLSDLRCVSLSIFGDINGPKMEWESGGGGGGWERELERHIR